MATLIHFDDDDVFEDEDWLSYKEERDVVAKALRRYIDYLESQAYDIGNR